MMVMIPCLVDVPCAEVEAIAFVGLDFALPLLSSSSIASGSAYVWLEALLILTMA